LSGWVALGREAWVDQSNTLSLCSDTFPCSRIWLNSPQQTTNNAAGQSVAFLVQAASGTDQAGGNLTLAAGQGTGIGANGSLYLQIANRSEERRVGKEG